MGTKNNPGHWDCYSNALPDEPMFILLARDPDFFDLVMEWADRRRRAIQRGERPASDHTMVDEAEECAFVGSQWRRDNDGKWRREQCQAPQREVMIAAIEAAVARERARCVALARAIGVLVHDSHTDQTIYDCAFRACGRDIAKAIQSGDEP